MSKLNEKVKAVKKFKACRKFSIANLFTPCSFTSCSFPCLFSLCLLFLLNSCASFYDFTGMYPSSEIVDVPKATIYEPVFEVENVEIQSVEMFEHIVSSGETLGLIANWYTGETSNWEEIQLSNPNLDPIRMVVGELILIPEYLLIRRDAIPKSVIENSKAIQSKIKGDFAKGVGSNEKVNVKTEREKLLEELLKK